MRHPIESLTRRSLLGHVPTALGGVGLLSLLGSSGSANVLEGWKPGQGMTHHAPKAKRVLQIFCPGAASHMDLWEHKPELDKHHGEPMPGEEDLVSFQGKN